MENYVMKNFNKFNDVYNKIISEQYTFKHPFSFTKSSQEQNKVYDDLKAGKESDGIILTGS